MAVTFKRLGNVMPSGVNASSTIYTVPVGVKVHLHSLLICNTSAQIAYVSVWLVPSGESAIPQNQVLCLYPVDAYNTINCLGHQVLEAGGSVIVYSDSGDDASFTLSGEEIS